MVCSAETNRVVQVKYTNQSVFRKECAEMFRRSCMDHRSGKCMLLISVTRKSKGLVATERACLFLDQIKREKGVWWMPWQ